MEQNAKYYDDIYRDSERYSIPFDQCNYFEIWEMVLTWIDKEDNILDIGCGPGQFAEMLFDTFGADLNYRGIDFSGVAIKQARERAHYPFNWIDAVEYSGYKYHDKFILLEFLEHVENDIEVLELIPSGSSVIFGVPSYESKAHVRTFKTKESIFERYDELLNIQEMYKFSFNERRYITLVKSTKI